MQFLFIDWLDAVVDWQPPGVLTDRTCHACEDARLGQMGVFSVLPHELVHGCVADVANQIEFWSNILANETAAERYVFYEVEAILPEVAELWEQHASPRMHAWIDEQLEALDDVETEKSTPTAGSVFTTP